ncbi:MAG: type II secretion system GspH family protein [Verrucomicrobiales bacterium]|nr:type II secretion system GspH family protein [Verrucomicrobiales bacterium]
MKVTKLNKKQKGMTLIEITLVIAILLSLIAILFLGINAYKKGADRSKCILTMASVEKLVISHGNMYDVPPLPTGSTSDAASALPVSILTEVQYAYLAQPPVCPTNPANYTFTGFMPNGEADSDPYTSCGQAAPPHPFRPYDT